MIFSSIFLLLAVKLFAQPNQHGPREGPTVADRWKRDSIKLQLYVNLSPPQAATVKPVFLSFYNSLDAHAEHTKTTPPPRVEIEKAIKERMNALKKILDTVQMDRFETFEREFMPPPPPRQHKQMEIL